MTLPLDIFYMEEQITITIFRKKITIDQSHFVQLTPIIDISDICGKSNGIDMDMCGKSNGMEMGMCGKSNGSKIDMEMVHICLYYIIIVQRELQGRIDLKEVYMKRLAQFYVKQRMHFPVYEYAQVCSNATETPLDECIHMIFFLVYGRLTTKAYVDTLITKKRRINASTNFHSHSATPKILLTERIETHVEEQSHANYAFIHELKNALKPMLCLEKQKNRKRGNIHSFAYKQEKEKEHKLEETQRTMDQFKRKIKQKRYLPCKVHLNEKSSLFSILWTPKQSENEKRKAKMQMRKQKFNENFNPYQILFKTCQKKPSFDQRSSTESIFQMQELKNPQKFIKKPEFLTQLLSKIQTRNAHLDYVTTKYSRNKTKQTSVSSFLNPIKEQQIGKTEEQKLQQMMMSAPKVKKQVLKNTRTSLMHVPSEKQLATQAQKVAHKDIIEQKQFQPYANAEMQERKKKLKKRNYKRQYRDFMKTPLFNIQSMS